MNSFFAFHFHVYLSRISTLHLQPTYETTVTNLVALHYVYPYHRNGAAYINMSVGRAKGPLRLVRKGHTWSYVSLRFLCLLP